MTKSLDKLREHAQRAPQVEEVATPEWAALDLPAVHVRALNGTRRDAYDASLWDVDGKRVDLSNQTAKLCALGLCDAAGAYRYRVEDAAWLGELEAGPLQRIADRVRALSGMLPEALEDARKN